MDEKLAQAPHMQAAQKMGFDMGLLTRWATEHGQQVVEDAIALVQDGFSTDWVANTLEHFGIAGPAALSFLRGLHQEKKSMEAKAGAGQIVPGTRTDQPGGFFNNKTVLQLLINQASGMLPGVLSGPGLLIVQGILKGLADSLTTTS